MVTVSARWGCCSAFRPGLRMGSHQWQQTGWSSYFLCFLPGNRWEDCREKRGGKENKEIPAWGAGRRENGNGRGSSAASKNLMCCLALRTGGKSSQIQAPQHDCESHTHGPTDSQHCCGTCETPWEAARVSGDMSLKAALCPWWMLGTPVRGGPRAATQSWNPPPPF